MHVSDNQKYVSGCRLYACINTRKFKGLHLREMTSSAEDQKHDEHGMSIISIIAENKLHAYHKTNLPTMKVYNT